MPRSLPCRLDVVVVGAGPAGSAAAMLLARLGWRVALVERGPRHRPKACGQCLHPRAGRTLERLAVMDDVRRTAAGTTRLLRLHEAARPSITAMLGRGVEPREGFLVDRSRFDQLLIDRAAEAGAIIVQPAAARLRGLDAGGAAVEIETPRAAAIVTCGLVVGADGLRSAIAIAAGCAERPAGRRKYGWALRLSVPERRAEAIAPGAIEMFVVPGGYLGVVRHGPGELHVAGLCRASAAGALNPWTMIESAAARFELLREAGLDRARDARSGRLLGAGPMPWRPRRVSVAGVALVGDAAGYVEPFTGEGMSWALESASVLASVAGGGTPGAWSPRLAARYRRAWSARIGRSHTLCRLLAAVLERPRLKRAALSLARRTGAAAYLAGRIAAP